MSSHLWVKLIVRLLLILPYYFFLIAVKWHPPFFAVSFTGSMQYLILHKSFFDLGTYFSSSVPLRVH